MIVKQLADFLNETVLPQYLGKESIKVEDLQPIISVGSPTTTYQPPVEPTKIASMKTTDYTSGTATIVNTENANKPFACSSTNTSSKTLSECVLQDTAGIKLDYYGSIKTADGIIADNYVINLKIKYLGARSVTIEDDLDEMTIYSEAICGFGASSATTADFSFRPEMSKLIFTVNYNTTASADDIEVVTDGWTKVATNLSGDRHWVSITKSGSFSENSEHTLVIAKVDDKIVYTLDDDVIFIETIVTNTKDKSYLYMGTNSSSVLCHTFDIEELDIFKINEE